jgi:Uma2 family endonuclease
VTPEQYLAIERAAETRSEYYNGRMYARAGGSPKHAFIIGNFAGEFRNALKKSACRVVSSDLRVCVSPDGLYTYPDIVVVCGPLQLLEGDQDTLLNPRVVVEVLSPSTEGYNRGFKSQQYRTIASLEEYALVSQSEPRVELFRRQPAGSWLLSEFIGLDAVCHFGSLDCGILLAEIYDKVSFGDEGPVVT